MAESKDVVRDRVRKFRELKKKLAVTVTECNDVTVSPPKKVLRLPSFTDRCDGCELLYELQRAVVDLQTRVSELERQLDPNEVSRKSALRPGGHPAELYGA